MGCLQSNDAENQTAAFSREQSERAENFIDWSDHGRVPLPKGSSFGQPLVRDDDSILWVCSQDDKLILNSYDAKTKEYTSLKTIEIEGDAFNVSQCVYALDSDDNTLTFVINNKELLSVNIAEGKVTSRRSMTPNDDKFATIQGTNKGTFLLGGRDENSECISVDYVDDEKSDEKDFGRLSTTLTLGYRSRWRILVMGGVVTVESMDGQIGETPTKALWMVDHLKQEWEKRQLARPMTQFGAIVLKNEYIIFFGGWQVKGRSRAGSEPEQILEMSRQMYALRLRDGQWLRLMKKLPRKSQYFAVYVEGAKNVHLYTYRGHHYTIAVKELMECIENAQDMRKTWEVPKTEAGKTVLPTKSKSITNMGPKIDDSDDEKEQ